MEDDCRYQHKYLKYKQKYTLLMRKQQGGGVWKCWQSSAPLH